ncbi:MAG: hypothetical protein NT027_00740 [Proteobacteria bacterium]|nr:hypothetical protein [Pseudomonadota bacterium]
MRFERCFTYFCQFLFLLNSEFSNAEDFWDESASKQEVNHRIGYSLIGVGGFASWISFAGAFSGGDSRDCAEEKNRSGSDTERECRDRQRETNKKFVKTMGYIFVGGLFVMGSGAALVAWSPTSTEVAQVTFSFNESAQPIIGLSMNFP